MQKRSTILYMVEGAMMIAVATILANIKFFTMPQGGTITLEMVPIVLMALRNGSKWGVLTGFVHGIIQMILGFSNVMYCATLISQIGCILLDYVLAFSVLGLAAFFAKPFIKNWKIGYIIGAIIVCLLRFACSFLSGWLLWGSYAPEGQAAWIYSLVYNASYMVPDTIIVAVVIGCLVFVAPVLFVSKAKSNAENE